MCHQHTLSASHDCVAGLLYHDTRRNEFQVPRQTLAQATAVDCDVYSLSMHYLGAERIKTCQLGVPFGYAEVAGG